MRKVEGHQATAIPRLIQGCLDIGWIVSPSEAVDLWTAYSQSMSAGWIDVPIDEESLQRALHEGFDYLFSTIRNDYR